MPLLVKRPPFALSLMLQFLFFTLLNLISVFAECFADWAQHIHQHQESEDGSKIISVQSSMTWKVAHHQTSLLLSLYVSGLVPEVSFEARITRCVTHLQPMKAMTTFVVTTRWDIVVYCYVWICTFPPSTNYVKSRSSTLSGFSLHETGSNDGSINGSNSDVDPIKSAYCVGFLLARGSNTKSKSTRAAMRSGVILEGFPLLYNLCCRLWHCGMDNV